MKNNQFEFARYQRYFTLLRALWEHREDFRAYLGILLSLAAISFFTLFALKPTLVTIGELIAQIRSQKETVSRLDQKIKNLQEAQKIWQKITPDLPTIDQALPETPNPHLFARQIEIFSSRQGVDVRDISLGKVVLVGGEEVGLQTFPFSFTVQGEPARVFSFLSQIQILRRPLIWEIITLAGKKSQNLPEAPIDQLVLTVSGNLPFYQTKSK